MKKMMIIAAVALLAIVAQAGQVSWTTSSVKTALESNAFSATSLGNGNSGIALLFIGDATAQAATATALANGTFTSAGAVASAVFSTKGGTTGLYGTYANTTVVSAYVVVFDDAAVPAADGSKNYMISSVITKTFTASGNQSYAFGTVEGVWHDYGVVPEPASAALLAVGAAVFGLRRKFRK